jgi:signal transduction histidine kinase
MATTRSCKRDGGLFRVRHARTLAAAATALAGAFWIAGGVLLLLDRQEVYGNHWFLWGLFSITGVAYVVAGNAIVRRQPENALGWLMFFIAVVLAMGPAASSFVIYAVRVSPGSLPGPGVVVALGEMSPTLTLMGILLVLQLFPSGRPVSGRWRWVVWATLLAWFGINGLVHMLEPHTITAIWSDDLSYAHVRLRDPLGLQALRVILDLLGPVAGIIALGTAVLSLASLFVRRRRADAVTRIQLRWLGLVAGFALAWTVVVFPLTGGNPLYWTVITPLVALGIPISVGIAIVRYRLLDVDVVIKKTVVFGVVAGVLVTLYLAVIALATLGAISRLVVGAVLLLITFNPVRKAARGIADRIVYGRRATSYEVLAEFSQRMGDTYASDDVLPRMAQILSGATGASAATVWLRIGNELQPAETAGDPAVDPAPMPLRGDALPELPADLAAEVRHQGELLGALSVSMPANDPLDPGRGKLVRDLASQAGLVLRNVRLIEELRASRQRLVAAQDEERRKLERNLHDGAQQQLVALSVQLKLAQTMVDRDAAKAGELLTTLQGTAAQAIEDLRDLARGIYPPLLADRGLPAAIEAQARRAAVPVTVESDGIGRYPQDVEAAVYFSCLEALNNVAKYAGATAATVSLTQPDGQLLFSVVDDGRGFDASGTTYGTGLQGMADRLDAVGGGLRVDSRPHEGTTITGWVPVDEPRGGP